MLNQKGHCATHSLKALKALKVLKVLKVNKAINKIKTYYLHKVVY